ncbi:MAG: DNA-binding protein [Clostridia bacterium]|nr:DNA-binding protein [Clostridia bacterium]
MDKDINMALLFDTYGSILSDLQHDCLDMHYNQDFSLSEISDNVGKTRQGVYDSIKRSEQILKNLEKKLGFLKKTNDLKEKIDEIKKLISEMPDISSNLQTKEKIEEIKEILNKIQF